MRPAARVSSFRDPAGRVVIVEGRILRWISHTHREQFDAFLASSLVQKCVGAGQIASYCQVDPAEARELSNKHKLTESGFLTEGDLIIEHDPVPFPSFPYEWPSEMLAAAGLLTLDLAESLLDDRLGLKDATPYNILFRGTAPVFTDVLSIESRDCHEPLWLPYAQFSRTFLLPLALNSRFGIPLESLLLGRRDGIEPEEAYRICGLLARLRPPFLTLATLPTLLGSHAESRNLYRKRQVRRADQAKFVLRGILRELRQQLERLKGSGKGGSRWSTYAEACESYTPQQLEQKAHFIDHVLSNYRPRRLLDAGCNTGQFSLQAAKAGASVVAVDCDPVVVGQLWRSAAREGLDILPLVVNLARPSPAVGWRNAECSSFLDRAQGAFDMVFVLALLHHLLVSERIPLAEVVNLVADLTTDLAVIEYVGTADLMFQRLLRGRQALHETLSRDTFECAIRKQFHILQSEKLTGTCRHLYLLRKLSGSSPREKRHILREGVTI